MGEGGVSGGGDAFNLSLISPLSLIQLHPTKQEKYNEQNKQSSSRGTFKNIIIVVVIIIINIVIITITISSPYAPPSSCFFFYPPSFESSLSLSISLTLSFHPPFLSPPHLPSKMYHSNNQDY